jgi:hypothetical protein
VQDEICVGRKEIIDYFKSLRLINPYVNYQRAWFYIVRWKKTKNLKVLMYRLPNNDKPMIIKTEIVKWAKIYNEIKWKHNQPKIKEERIIKLRTL